MQRLGVIGGTGLIDMTLSEQLGAYNLTLTQRDNVMVETPYGDVPLTCIELSDGEHKKELIFLQRHHNNGEASRPPHMIEHRANIRALLDAGCEAVMAVCSVGAIQMISLQARLRLPTNTSISQAMPARFTMVLRSSPQSRTLSIRP